MQNLLIWGKILLILGQIYLFQEQIYLNRSKSYFFGGKHTYFRGKYAYFGGNFTIVRKMTQSVFLKQKLPEKKTHFTVYLLCISSIKRPHQACKKHIDNTTIINIKEDIKKQTYNNNFWWKSEIFRCKFL